MAAPFSCQFLSLVRGGCFCGLVENLEVTKMMTVFPKMVTEKVISAP